MAENTEKTRAINEWDNQLKLINFKTPVEDGTYHGITLGVQASGWLPVLCSYLQNYTTYDYEILWLDRSHQGGVQCT